MALALGRLRRWRPGEDALWLIAVLGSLTALGPFTVDLIVPTLGAVQDGLSIPEELTQFTVAGATAGLAVGQLVVGPWSDRVGRRLPLIAGAALHVLATIGVAVAWEMWTLIAFRFVQGLAAAACGVVALAIVRDLSSREALLARLSRLALIVGVVTVGAPLLGAVLLDHLGWRGVFAALAAYGSIATIIATALVRETLPRHLRRTGAGQRVWSSYRRLIADRTYVGAVGAGAFSFAGLFAYIAASNPVFQRTGDLPPSQLAALISINSVGILVGIQLSAALARRISPSRLLLGATLFMPAMATAIAISGAFAEVSTATFIFLWLFVVGHGVAFPCVQALALAAHPSEAGAAASVMGAANFALGSGAAVVVGLVGVTGSSGLGLFLLVTSASAMVCAWSINRVVSHQPRLR